MKLPENTVPRAEPWIRIDIITAVPALVEPFLQASILARAQAKNVAVCAVHNLHDYGVGKHKLIDDTLFGGGAGMLLMCEPIFSCIETLQKERTYDEIIFLTPDGVPFQQSIANELSLKKNIILLAGHYKGIDQRVRDRLITREISIGDYVLTGGEIPALVLTDAIIRLLPGAMNDAESGLLDSFQEDLLDPPHYTKPAVFRDMPIPEILLSGNHAHIDKWRHTQAVEKTRQRRPDLLNWE